MCESYNNNIKYNNLYFLFSLFTYKLNVLILTVIIIKDIKNVNNMKIKFQKFFVNSIY